MVGKHSRKKNGENPSSSHKAFLLSDLRNLVERINTVRNSFEREGARNESLPIGEASPPLLVGFPSLEKNSPIHPWEGPRRRCVSGGCGGVVGHHRTGADSPKGGMGDRDGRTDRWGGGTLKNRRSNQFRK